MFTKLFTPPEFNITDPRIYHVETAEPIKLFYLICESLPHFFARFTKLRPDYTFPKSFIEDLCNIRLSRLEIGTVLFLAFLFTLLRWIVEKKMKSVVERLGICNRFKHKLPETVWKLFYYTTAWGIALYTQTMEKGLNAFNDPLTIWNGWSSGIPPVLPFSVTVVYAVQSAYYVHSIYATVFMDLWRADSWIMFVHHFIAVALLLLSYLDGFMLAGVLLVFLHDSSDAALECTKLGHYMKLRQDGRRFVSWNIFGNISFAAFAVMWVVCRLYWFSCKLLYATLYGAVYLGPQDAAFFPCLGAMLFSILLMNIYWFNFIARMVVRVALTGEDPEDNREYDTTAVSGINKEELERIAAKKKKI